MNSNTVSHPHKKTKSSVAGICVVLALMATASECQSETQCVLRLSSGIAGEQWQMAANKTNVSSAFNRNLAEHVSRIGLQSGDIVLCQIRRTAKPIKTLESLASYCRTNQIALYLCLETNDVFAIPIYHWSAPFNNPRDMSNASFFFEGKHLGEATNGYWAMVRELERSRAPCILILGSRHNINSGFATDDSPYGEYDSQLDKLLKKRGTQRLILSSQP